MEELRITARQRSTRSSLISWYRGAVANLKLAFGYCLPHVKVGGRFVSYKSGKLNEGLPQLKSDSCAKAARQKSRFISAYRNGG